MKFRCPGCKKRKPVTAGLLVIEHGPHSKRVRGNQNSTTPPVVAILCGPCTGRILVERAKA